MTRFRSQTDEQLAARWNKEPWVSPNGIRYPYPANDTYALAPRVERIPSYYGTTYVDYLHDHDTGYGPPLDFDDWAEWVGMPPVNRVLVAFRDALSSGEYEAVTLTANWVGLIATQGGIFEVECEDATPAEIDHARRVLTRLAAL